MARSQNLSFAALTIEGGLISPAMLEKIAAADAKGQSEADYGLPKGLTLRDELARYFRIGQAHWRDFAAIEHPTMVQTVTFTQILLHDVFGFSDIGRARLRTAHGRNFPIALEALDGKVPVAVAPLAAGLDSGLPELGDGSRRSATLLAQEWLNANSDFYWGLAASGDRLRLLRDNASFTRPAYFEANLALIFEDEAFADFSVLWLLLHASRFRTSDGPADCWLEKWRETGQQEGVAARDRLRGGFEAAILSLGNGFLAHPANTQLSERLRSGELPLPDYFNQLLRLVYRLIFLLAAEDRGLLHPPTTKAAVRKLYAEGYSLGRLRDRSVRRSAWDRHHDAWEGLLITFGGLAQGEARLGLPALGGLFDQDVLKDLQTARLPNAALLEAVYRLAWLKEDGGPVPVNWRDMETEELGSVYEGLLELTPRLVENGRAFGFAEGAEARGNARKTTGSYYTPDSLVQALLDSALDPVLDRAERAEDPAKALLELKAIDPACGSGHFLLAAARRIASRLAHVRAEGVPTAADYRHALRDVVRSCIYGVDRNPMAVELAKVALWIETVEPGKPLGFLDANIRCGDALVGVFDLAVLEDGIPDAAYKPLPGDDNDTAKGLKGLNRSERDAGLLRRAIKLDALTAQYHDFASIDEDDLHGLEKRRKAFNKIMKSPDRWALQCACDAFVAAFFLPKQALPSPQAKPLIPTTRHVWEALDRRPVQGVLAAEIDRAASGVSAFHWPLEFPDIMSGGGFDAVLGNPPWERIKLQEEEFFASRAPEIANAKNAAKRKAMIARLEETDPVLANDWAKAVQQAAAQSTFMRLSGRFPFGGVGDVNTYAVFADLFRQLVTLRGRAALILPTGLVDGFTYRKFLGHLLKTKTLASYFGFENEELLFRHITNKVKFGILTMTGVGAPVEQPWFTAHLRQPTQISDPERLYALTIDEIEAINPNTLNLPAFRWTRDAEVAAKIHKAAPVLVRKSNDMVESPWDVRFATLFHMANDAQYFIDHSEVADLIERRNLAVAILSDGRRVFPLYEGKMFWHFDHRYGTYEGQTKKQANKGVLPRVSDELHDDQAFRIQPLYWVSENLTLDKLGDDADQQFFYSWRDVGPAERTFVGTVLPKTAVGHAAPILFTSERGVSRAALYALLSSLVVDYAARQKTNRMTYFIVEQLPVLGPKDLARSCSWLPNPIDQWLSERALELYYTNAELRPFAEELGRDHGPFHWDPKRRDCLQAEIDAAVMHLYGLERADVEWLLNSFTVLRKYEERDHDEFRTREAVLSIYDEMARARRDGDAYLSPLSLPPADPSCCHV